MFWWGVTQCTCRGGAKSNHEEFTLRDKQKCKYIYIYIYIERERERDKIMLPYVLHALNKF
jgi:hypothetical protein